MSELSILCIHCTATAEGRPVTKNEILQWHMGPFEYKSGKVKYKGIIYRSRLALPNEFVGGVSIRKMKGNGWSKPGYTDMIHLDGSLENLTPFDQDDNIAAWELTYGAKGINGISRHIVYVGGKNREYTQDKDTRTDKQKEALKIYAQYTILRHPSIKVGGHNQFTNKKQCPSFDVPFWCNSICIEELNIYKKA